MGDVRRDTSILVGRRRRPTEFRDGHSAPSVVRKVSTIVEPRAPHFVSLVPTHAVVLLKKKKTTQSTWNLIVPTVLFRENRHTLGGKHNGCIQFFKPSVHNEFRAVSFFHSIKHVDVTSFSLPLTLNIEYFRRPSKTYIIKFLKQFFENINFFNVILFYELIQPTMFFWILNR